MKYAYTQHFNPNTMYKCASCGFTSEEGGEHCGMPMEKSMKKASMYKCASCGATSEESGEHCGAPMGKVCACGSGKYAADCCEKPE